MGLAFDIGDNMACMQQPGGDKGRAHSQNEVHGIENLGWRFRGILKDDMYHFILEAWR